MVHRLTQAAGRRSALAAGGLIALLAVAPSSAAAAGAHSRAALAAYQATRGPVRATARFIATYTGSGTYHTTYHATPPSDPNNPGGPHDTNDASDSSTQQWSLRYRNVLTVPACAKHGPLKTDPCWRVLGLFDASGTSTATGTIKHSHVDGLFAGDNATAQCQLSAATPRGALLTAAIRILYSRRTRTFALTALDPMVDALSRLPGGCPQGDSIDGLYDDYFIPGFSFLHGYGPNRWFAGRTVVIPARVFHHSKTIAIPLAATPSGTPPADCAVADPSREQCSTGGAWSGMLKLTARR